MQEKLRALRPAGNSPSEAMITEADSSEVDPEAAIAQVLQAESAAKADALRCREEAQAIVARAEATAQAIAARTDARLVRIRERMRTRAARQVASLRDGSLASGEEAQVWSQRIEQAAQRFAAELMGEGP